AGFVQHVYVTVAVVVLIPRLERGALLFVGLGCHRLISTSARLRSMLARLTAAVYLPGSNSSLGCGLLVAMFPSSVNLVHPAARSISAIRSSKRRASALTASTCLRCITPSLFLCECGAGDFSHGRSAHFLITCMWVDGDGFQRIPHPVVIGQQGANGVHLDDGQHPIAVSTLGVGQRSPQVCIFIHDHSSSRAAYPASHPC